MLNTYIKKKDHKREMHLAKLRELTKRLEPISKYRRDEIGNQMITKVNRESHRDRQPN